MRQMENPRQASHPMLCEIVLNCFKMFLNIVQVHSINFHCCDRLARARAMDAVVQDSMERLLTLWLLGVRVLGLRFLGPWSFLLQLQIRKEMLVQWMSLAPVLWRSLTALRPHQSCRVKRRPRPRPNPRPRQRPRPRPRVKVELSATPWAHLLDDVHQPTLQSFRFSRR